MKKLIIVTIFISTAIMALAQETITPEQYVAQYKNLAIREMRRMGVPAAITLAQGILETESGNSDLVKKSNNHFGIKCKNTWTAATVTHDDDALGECFRSYNSAEDSYRDHSNFLKGSLRYGFLFRYDVKDYKAWAYGLKKAGYATNPQYPSILIKHIEQYDLQQYTLMGADETLQFDDSLNEDDKINKSLISSANNPSSSQDIKNDSATETDVSNNLLTVNGSTCVYVRKGTSLLAIATKNNIALSKLLGYNELLEDGLLVKSQYVFLEKKSKTSDKDFYTAKGGESLYDIAQQCGIQMQYMLDYNHLWGNEDIATGVKIYLKPGLIPSKKEIILAPVQEPFATTKLHTVQVNEGLYTIARKYNVTVQELKQWNKLSTNTVNVGQQLIVSK